MAYYEADLFCTQAKELAKKGNKVDAAAAADKAESVLKYGLFFNPKLDGPDRVAQYKKLLGRGGPVAENKAEGGIRAEGGGRKGEGRGGVPPDGWSISRLPSPFRPPPSAFSLPSPKICLGGSPPAETLLS